MGLRQMLLKIIITDAAISAVAALCLTKLRTAILTPEFAIGHAALALGCVTETASAVLAEMFRIFRILDAHSRGTFGFCFAAVQAELAKWALLRFVKADSAALTDMAIPFYTLHAVILAVTAQVRGI